MKSRKSRSLRKIRSLRKRRSVRKNRSKSIRRRKQSGGFIGTMYNVAMLPVNMVAKPFLKKIGSMMSDNSNSGNSNSMSNSGNSGNSGGDISLDNSKLNSIRMNNSNISTLKQLGSYGYDNRTLNSYIQQLQHVNI